MKAVFYVLTRPELLQKLLSHLQQNGICGCTIFESKGMARELANSDNEHVITGFLRSFFSQESLRHSCTLMLVLPEEKVARLLACIKEVAGDMTQPDTGIFFSVPIDFVEGFKQQ
ncbi:MAG: hypothetical protein LBH24_04165 [Clostridiales bacterium]|jgi:nitrogen regulatory protein PII|nr:hypothetical protein [Clostridiales bacterium]